MQGPPGAIFYLGCFIMNLIFVVVYALLRRGIPGKNLISKGLIYGLCVFAVGQLNGMFATYIFMTVAWQAVLYWTIQGIIFTPIAGAIASAIYGKD